MSALKDEIKIFIGRYIRSIAHLEAILFLYKRNGEKLSVQQIGAELRTSADYARTQLEELANLGLVSRCEAADCYFYQSSADLDSILEQISADYSRHRLAIIDLLYSQPMDKIRGFSDAFKIKKE